MQLQPLTVLVFLSTMDSLESDELGLQQSKIQVRFWVINIVKN